MAATRVRFAPSPTGELHIGGARTALFNLIFARANEGVFILRIDDTDLERSRPEYIEALLASMRWLRLQWDEGPYYQSQRIPEYNREAARLLDEQKAYHCYCLPGELEAGREEARKAGKAYLYPGRCRILPREEERAYLAEGRNPVLRLKVPGDGETVVDDSIRGEVRFENSNLDDFIIVKSNGLPTYNFASVVDDYQMSITHVIRGEEHLSNTPRQQLCAEALGYSLPVYAHLPMILAPDRSKLSKRHGATAVEEFRDLGYLPEALVNYMALLGWSHGEEEITSLSDMIKDFLLKRVHKTAAVYDTVKLTWMNGHYLRESDLDRVVSLAIPFYAREGLINESPDEREAAYLKKVVSLVRDRGKTLAELAGASTYFFKDEFTYDEKGSAKHFRDKNTAGLLRAAAERLRRIERFSADAAEAAYRELAGESAVSTGRLIHPTRLAVSGRTGGPALFEMIALLGKDRVLRRMEKAASLIESGSL